MSRTKESTVDMLKRMGACPFAIRWVARHPRWSRRDLWNNCLRGDWLLWMAGKLNVDRRYVVAAACACVQGVLYLDDDHRPRHVVQVAIRWTQGSVGGDRAEVHRAVFELAEGRRSTPVSSAAYCAGAASYSDVELASAAVSHSVSAFVQAAYVANVLVSPTMRRSVLRQSADRVRSTIPWPMVESALKEDLP